MTTWTNTTYDSDTWDKQTGKFYVYSGYWVAGYAEDDADYWSKTSFNSDSWTKQTAGA